MTLSAMRTLIPFERTASWIVSSMHCLPRLVDKTTKTFILRWLSKLYVSFSAMIRSVRCLQACEIQSMWMMRSRHSTRASRIPSANKISMTFGNARFFNEHTNCIHTHAYDIDNKVDHYHIQSEWWRSYHRWKRTTDELTASLCLRHKQKANKEKVCVCTCQPAATATTAGWCTFPFPHLFRGNQSGHKIHATTWCALYTQRRTICQMVFLFFSVICWTTTQLGSLSYTIYEDSFYRWNDILIRRRKEGKWKGHCINKPTQSSFSLWSSINKYPPSARRRPTGRLLRPSAAQEVYSTAFEATRKKVHKNDKRRGLCMRVH